jgi:hypothetical protein
MDITLSFPAVRDQFVRLARGDTSGVRQSKMRQLSARWKSNDMARFTGARTEEVLGWVDNGYRPKDFKAATRPPVAPKRRRTRFSEDEGELMVDLALSGHDRPFTQQYVTRPRVAGFRVQIGLAVNAGVDSQVIAQYGEWVAGMLQRFVSEGLDVAVDVKISLKGWIREDESRRDNILIRVKEAGAINDFRSWSVIFSPAGKRTLCFTANCMAADKIGKTITQGMGAPDAGKAFDVRYDPAARLLSVECPGSFKEFPAELMTAKLERALNGTR